MPELSFFIPILKSHAHLPAVANILRQVRSLEGLMDDEQAQRLVESVRCDAHLFFNQTAHLGVLHPYMHILDSIYTLLLTLAWHYPLNTFDPITLFPIPDENKICVSSGHQFDLFALIQFHNQRAPRFPIDHREGNYKVLLDCLTNQPFNDSDISMIEFEARHKIIIQWAIDPQKECLLTYASWLKYQMNEQNIPAMDCFLNYLVVFYSIPLSMALNYFKTHSWDGDEIIHMSSLIAQHVDHTPALLMRVALFYHQRAHDFQLFVFTRLCLLPALCRMLQHHWLPRETFSILGWLHPRLQINAHSSAMDLILISLLWNTIVLLNFNLLQRHQSASPSRFIFQGLTRLNTTQMAECLFKIKLNSPRAYKNIVEFIQPKPTHRPNMNFFNSQQKLFKLHEGVIISYYFWTLCQSLWDLYYVLPHEFTPVESKAAQKLDILMFLLLGTWVSSYLSPHTQNTASSSPQHEENTGRATFGLAR